MLAAQGIPPGDDMRAGDGPELVRLVNPDKTHELFHVDAVGAHRLRVLDVGELFGLGRDGG